MFIRRLLAIAYNPIILYHLILSLILVSFFLPALNFLQGYRKFLRKQVFEPAGLCLAEQQRIALAEEAKHVDEVKAKHEQGEFETLDQCTDVS